MSKGSKVSQLCDPVTRQRLSCCKVTQHPNTATKGIRSGIEKVDSDKLLVGSKHNLLPWILGTQ
eukprot:scaffold11940_cov116-Cylindrotheca_fusiformis.AAC.1